MRSRSRVAGSPRRLRSHPWLAGPGTGSGPAADEQVRVGGVRPACLPAGEPVEQDLIGEVVKRPGLAGDGQAAVAQVGVAELDGADLRRPGGVHGCQGHEDPGVRGGGRLHGAGDLPGRQGLEDRLPGAPDLQAAGRVSEDDAVLLRPGKQRPGGDKGSLTPRAVQRRDGGADIVAGDLAQVSMAGRPFQQRRAERGRCVRRDRAVAARLRILDTADESARHELLEDR